MWSQMSRTLILFLAAATVWSCTAVAQQSGNAATRGVVIAPSGFERVGSGPSSFFWIRDGLNGIVDTLANSVAFVDDTGRVVGRAALPGGFMVSSTESGENRVLLLSGDKRSVIELQRTIDPASPPPLTEQPLPPTGRASLAPAVRRSKTQLSVPSTPATARSSTNQLEVRSLTGSPLADAAEVGTDGAGERYVVWSEFVSANPSVVVRAFVGRYRSDGRLTGIAELPLAEMDYVPEEYVVVTRSGDVRVMVPTKSKLEIRTIPIQPVAAIDTMTRSNIASPNLLRRLSTEKGRVSDVETSVMQSQDAPEPRSPEPPNKTERGATLITPITRAKVLELGREFLTLQWTLTHNNYERAGVPDACNKIQKQYWLRPTWMKKDHIGQSMTRIPYRWGGFDDPKEFVRRLGDGYLAGDVCTCRDPTHNDCIFERSAGVDCSGFVSRAWGLVIKYGTSGLGALSTLVNNWQSDLGRLKAGDALNRAGNHVRLVVEAVSAPQTKIVVIESTTARSCKRLDGTVMTCEGVCECARPIAEFNGYQLLRYKGIRD